MKGRRDKIPALCRKGSRGEKGREKYLIFYLEKKTGIINFVVPKVKREISGAKAQEEKKGL